MSELNRRIIEALGIVIHDATSDPDRAPCFGFDREYHDEWIELPGGDCQPPPDYEHDLNAAILLTESMGDRFSLNRCDPKIWPAKWEACYTAPPFRSGWDEEITTAYNDNPATAICECWLAWHAAKGQGDDR